MLIIIGVGVLIAVVEFVIVGFVIGRGSLPDLNNALLAGVMVVIVTVVVVWGAMLVLKAEPGISTQETEGK